MCQEWFSVIGQMLDCVGFLFIAFEWYHQLKRDHERRMRELQKAHDKQSAEILGREYKDPDSDKDNWRIYQPLFLAEWAWRRKMFMIGAGCFVIGIAFQIVGSWPGLISACK